MMIRCYNLHLEKKGGDYRPNGLDLFIECRATIQNAHLIFLDNLPKVDDPCKHTSSIYTFNESSVSIPVANRGAILTCLPQTIP